MEARRPAHNPDQLRRRAYVVAAWVATVAQLGMLVLDVANRTWYDVPSTVLGTVMSVGVILAVQRFRVPTPPLNLAVAAMIGVVELMEFLSYARAPAVRPQEYLSFIVLTTLWFGLIPVRPAALLSAVAYVGFAALVLSRPEYDLTLLIYLACVTTIIGTVASFGQQVTGQREEAAAFQQQSRTDALTGLPNRRAALEELRRHWEAGAGAPDLQCFALLMIDLDHFKAINDRYSHAVGDQVLTATGPALRPLLGPDDVLARWGGEEFMLILPDCTAQRAYDTAARLNGRALTLPGTLPPVTFSAGAALSHEADSLDGLLALVDQRMYAAKDAGRQQVRWDAHPPTPGWPEAACAPN